MSRPGMFQLSKMGESLFYIGMAVVLTLVVYGVCQIFKE